MTVYAVAQFRIHDRERYDRYVARFMGVFEKFEGKVLSADYRPQILQGEWNFNRIVLMSFPTRAAFFAWAGSAEYREIVDDRIASSDGMVLLAEGLS